jgi:hypothetical protein
MSVHSLWKVLFEASHSCATGSINDQADTLERVASLADYQSDRLSTGIAAISELLEGAINADRVDGVVAAHICGLLAAMAGLSVQLATVSRDANRKLTDITTPAKPTPLTTYSHPLSPD